MDKCMNKKQKTRVTSTLIAEVTGIPDSSVRAAKNGRLKDLKAVQKIEKATSYMEDQLATIVEKGKKKFSTAA